MTNRRDFLKAGAVAGSGLLDPMISFAERNRPSGNTLIDFQAFLPGHFDGKPFAAKNLKALENEAKVGRYFVFPETTPRPDNQGLARRIRSDSRMIGCASVNPALDSGAASELERAVKEYGFKGVRLSPIAHDYPIEGEMVNPVLEKARDLGIPVTVDSDAENCRFSRIAVMAAKFPEVTFILDMGFRPRAYPPGMPAGKEFTETAQKYPNLYFGITALTASEPHHIKSIAAAAGPERMIFGSSAPYGIPLFAVWGVRHAELGTEAERLIFGENLKRVYKLA
ncbi:MAG: amidohydrolase family protein [Candidatus Latescibacterota bacterium]